MCLPPSFPGSQSWISLIQGKPQSPSWNVAAVGGSIKEMRDLTGSLFPRDGPPTPNWDSLKPPNPGRALQIQSPGFLQVGRGSLSPFRMGAAQYKEYCPMWRLSSVLPLPGQKPLSRVAQRRPAIWGRGQSVQHPACLWTTQLHQDKQQVQWPLPAGPRRYEAGPGPPRRAQVSVGLKQPGTTCHSLSPVIARAQAGNLAPQSAKALQEGRWPC